MARTSPGREVFRLYDTYGFPFDLTVELAREQGLESIRSGSTRRWRSSARPAAGAADAFSDRARRGPSSTSSSPGGQARVPRLHEQTEADARVVALVSADGPVDEAEAGDAVEVILDRTPFYGESGGQIGDTGTIRTETGSSTSTTPSSRRRHLRPPRALSPRDSYGPANPRARRSTPSGAAHPPQSHRHAPVAPRAAVVLGEETHQAGSLVAPDRLRFDFTARWGRRRPASTMSPRSSTTRSARNAR